MEPFNKPNRNRLLRAAQGALASAAFVLLVACGGGGDSGTTTTGSTPPGGVSLKVVSFGDSLSDVGTYSAFVTPNFGGGRFTTNPGQIWTQDVASFYGDTLTAAVFGGFGTTVTSNGGFGYAQGGALVADQPGIGSPTLTAVPVAKQVQNYLTQHGSFNSGQLVLIQGGGNDVLLAAQSLAADSSPGNRTVQATNIVKAATTFATIVGTVLQNGATKVVLVNVPDVGKAPAGGASVATGGTLTALSVLFNDTLTQALGGIANKVILVNSFDFIDSLVTNAAANGFQVSNTGTACNLTLMQTRATTFATQNPSVLQPGQSAQQFGASLASSLFCSPELYTAANADQTYMFADSVHPTTRLHLLFAQQVEKQIAAAGIGH
jgi:phospholipase/lecithinase/hemolysin